MNGLFSFLDPVFPSAIVTVALFGLASARFIGMMIIMPLFSRSGIERLLRVGIATGFSAPLVFELTRQFGAGSTPPTIWILGVLLAKELLVGMALGILFATPMWAITMAGDVIDSYRNANASNTTDPINASETSILGTYLLVLGLALFIAAGGFQVMIAAIYRSFAIWPLLSFSPGFVPGSLDVLYALLKDIGRLAFIIAAPILVLMVVIDIMLMGFTRMNPQFQVFDSSNALKNLALVLALPIYVSFFSEYMNVQWPKFYGNVERLIPQ